MMKKVISAVVLLAVLSLGVFAMAEAPATPGTDDLTVKGATYIDGIYTGRGEGYNDYIEVEVTVEDGAIQDIKILYIADTTGVWDLAVPRVKAVMLEEQRLDVDTVSQATYSSGGYIEAVQNALQDAVAQDAAASSAGYIDGVYVGRGEGYNDYIEVEVTVEGGLIKDIKVLYVADTPGVWDLAVKRLTATMLEGQEIDVDTVTQATFTSKGFIGAVQNALKEAVK
jgi:uncharacterized protein with FMN-binding domain